MNRVLICTVGISLLTNRDHPWAGWKPRPSDPFHDPTNVDHWLETADVTHDASAETNTLKAIDVDEADSEIPVLVASTVADEGLDVPRLSRLVLAYPGRRGQGPPHPAPGAAHAPAPGQ